MEKYQTISVLFSKANHIEHHISENRIISTFSGYRIGDHELSIILEAVASLGMNGEIDFTLNALQEEDCYLKAAYFPAPFNSVNYDPACAYSVDPLQQGFLLPDNLCQNIMIKNNISKSEIMCKKFWKRLR